MPRDELTRLFNEHKLGKDLKQALALTQNASKILQGLPNIPPSQFINTTSKELLLPRNSLLAENEIATLDHVVEALQRLETSTQRLAQIITGAKQEYSFLLRHLQSHTSTSPWKLLPDDVWSEIFALSNLDSPVILPPQRRCTQPLEYEDPDGIPLETPWSYLEVCCRWRRIALNESRLWNNFIMDTEDKRLQNCSFIQHAQRVISYNKTPSLSLIRKADLYPSFLARRTSIWDNNTFIDKFLIPFSNQLTFASVSLYSRANMAEIEESLPDPFLPLLQSLKLQITNDDFSDRLPLDVPFTLMEKFLSSPHLKELEITSAFTDRIRLSDQTYPLPPPFPLNLKVSWKGITTLIMRGIYTEALVVYDIISYHCPNLEVLNAVVWPLTTLSNFQEMVTLPHLKKLSLSHAYTTILDRIRAEKLEELILVCSEDHVPPMPTEEETAIAIAEFGRRSSRISDLTLNFPCVTLYLGSILEPCRNLSSFHLHAMELPVSIMNFFTATKSWPRTLDCRIRLSDLLAFLQALQGYSASLCEAGNFGASVSLEAMVTVFARSEEEEDAVLNFGDLLNDAFENRGWYFDLLYEQP